MYSFRRGRDLIARYAEPGSDTYACVTGATSGIGTGFAVELAERGFNVLLISRSESKLKTVQGELKSRFKEVKFAYEVADFGSSNSI